MFNLDRSIGFSRVKANFFAIIIFIFLTTGSAAYSAEEVRLIPPTTSIPSEYFGMHIHRAADGTSWPNVPFGSWRLWDSSNPWFYIQPKHNQWNFKKLDRYLKLAKKNHTDVILPLGLTPQWASARPTEKSAYGLGYAAEPFNIDDWKQYVKKVGKRYKGRVKYYEIWNEPYLKMFYTGSVSKMVELTKIAFIELKKIDPEIRIISPTSDLQHNLKWFDEFLRLGGGKYIDVVAGHFYISNANPERVLVLYSNQLRALLKKHKIKPLPIWNTEAGYRIANEDNAQTGSNRWTLVSGKNAASVIARTYIVAWAAGIERYYWYSWEHNIHGFLNPISKTPKQFLVEPYTKVFSWLNGSTFKKCTLQEILWTCDLIDHNNKKAWLMWTKQNTEQTVSIPFSWLATQVEHLQHNEIQSIDTTNNQLLVTDTPIFVR